MILVNNFLFCGQNARSPCVIPTLSPLETEKLAHLPPEPNRWTSESLLVSIDDGPFPNQVKLMWLDEFGLL